MRNYIPTRRERDWYGMICAWRIFKKFSGSVSYLIWVTLDVGTLGSEGTYQVQISERGWIGGYEF